jgi:hypothetical protein
MRLVCDLGPYSASSPRRNLEHMALLAADVSKVVLRAIADAAPDAGPGVVTGVNIRHGWGDVVYVELAVGREHHTGLPFDRHGLGILRSQVQNALGSHRHNLWVVESHL